jgi:hypothetical protein
MADANAARRHEADTMDGRRIVIVAIALCVLIAACIAGAGWLTHAMAHRYARPVYHEPAGLPQTDGPPLEPDPAATLARFRAEKQALLQSYAWVDRPHGIARMPIEDAMRIVAAQAAATPASRSPESGR